MNSCDSKELSKKSKGWKILKSKKIIKRINKVFAFVTEDMIEDFLIVVSNNLYNEKCYTSGRSKTVIVKIGKEYTLSDVFQPISKYNEIEKVGGVSEGDDLKKFGLSHHKFTML